MRGEGRRREEGKKKKEGSLASSTVCACRYRGNSETQEGSRQIPAHTEEAYVCEDREDENNAIDESVAGGARCAVR